MPTARELKDTLFEAMNAHDLDRVLACYCPDAVYVTPVGVAEGHEQIAWQFEHLFTAFPDLHIAAWYKVESADPAVTEYTLVGTHTGPFLLPDGSTAEGTGRRVVLRGACACATENGRIITDRDYYDQLELYSQLGYHLEPGPAA
ncbi:ester cyclase [Microtetraspora niveoalba]|uniref:ester cyclase n=1 Tax=Microtetraspora niveoalba TaxID=46175 RepID=UPI0008321CEB|nr:ester cyclase [Microtetraspora niveoalba]